MQPDLHTNDAGVLLANLGTPDAPTAAAVRRYLAQFLWDQRVVEAPRWLWWPVLHGVVLPLRSPRSAALYRKVWSARGSPLLAHSQGQRAALEAALRPHFPAGVRVVLGMRYGNPSIARALEELGDHGIRRVLVLPAYPQYSATTVASTFDAVAAAMARARVVPELRFVSGYHLHPGYVAALAASVRTARAGEAGVPGTRLLFSFHGLPQRYVEAGDPYRTQCEETARAVAGALGLESEQWAIAFQSRVGRQPWLRPYTDELLATWAESEVPAVDVICPGFSADCLETLDEIAREARHVFLDRGGQRFRYITALNDEPEHIDALARLVLARTSDWRRRPSGAPAGLVPSVL